MRPAAGQGAFAETELLLKTPTVARTTTRVATPGEWRHALDLLAATAVRRDGAAAARHTEVRRRMRALARAARKFGRQP